MCNLCIGAKGRGWLVVLLAICAAFPARCVDNELDRMKAAANQATALLQTHASIQKVGDRDSICQEFNIDTGTTTFKLQYHTFPGDGAVDNRRLLTDGCSGYGMLEPNPFWYSNGFLGAWISLPPAGRSCSDKAARVVILERAGQRVGYDLVYEWPDAIIVVRTVALAGRDELYAAVYSKALDGKTPFSMLSAFLGYPLGFARPLDRCVHVDGAELKNGGEDKQPIERFDLTKPPWLLLTDHRLNADGKQAGQLGIVFDKTGMAKVEVQHQNNYGISTRFSSTDTQREQRFIVCNFTPMPIKQAEQALTDLAAHSKSLLSRAFDGLPDPFSHREPKDSADVLPAPPAPSADNGEAAPPGPIRALVACWRTDYGYDALVEARLQLERALGKENVEIRTGSPLVDWPQSYDALKKYQLVVITDLPTGAFTKQGLEDLRTYIEKGGHLVMVSSLSGWLQDPANPWTKSPIGNLLPMEPPAVAWSYRGIKYDGNTPLFKGFPPDLPLTARVGLCKPTAGATVLAGVRLLEADAAKGGTDPAAFIAEKKAGMGSLVLIHGYYVQNATVHLLTELKHDFFQSPYYPVFWDNLVVYLTGMAVTHPAAMPVRLPEPATSAEMDILTDNSGDIFRPGGRLIAAPKLAGIVAYPYEVQAVIEREGNPPISAGSYVLADKDASINLDLPMLDAGIYRLRLDLTKAGKPACTATGRFSIGLPLIAPDEFNFEVIMTPNNLGEADDVRIAGDLKRIGFTRISTIGGTIVGLYNGFNNREALHYSRMQEAGLRVRPVWYPVLFDLLGAQGRGLTATFPPAPTDPAFPDKKFLPYEYGWLNAFGEAIYGRMPLTEGMVVSDETTGLGIKMTERLAKGYQLRMGTAPATNTADPRFYEAMQYQLQTATNLVWLCRSTTAAYNKAWLFDSIISPNSFCGHSSTLVDVFGTISALGTSSPDEYWYGEQKLYLKSLCSMATLWSATGFSRLSRPGFTGGQLSNNHYMEFPEQVFAAISGGAQEYKVFDFDSASFEKHGRQDLRFAAIAKRTTADASRIGRTLNHYARSRARVALLYPNTAHVITSMGMQFNTNYLQMTGTANGFLDLTFAFQTEFELLRRMFGHVDVIFDEQVKRGDLKQYDLVVVGYCKQVEERTLRELRKYTQNGGTLLISSDSGQFNALQQKTGTLYDILPAVVGAETRVATDYTDTSMQKPTEWSTGNSLYSKPGAEVLFSFPDKTAACVRGTVGRGEAIVLGMPFAALRATSGTARRDLISYLLHQRVPLISKAEDEECSAITFTNERDGGRVFMVVNHHKFDAKTRVTAPADDDEARYTLADIVTGESLPFTVQNGLLSFEVTLPDRWGRALALLKTPPAALEVSVSGQTAEPGKKFMILVRMLGKDGQPIQATLPFNLQIVDPDGLVRDDLSGVRIVEQGIYVFSMPWPVNARKGQWTATVSDKISGATDRAIWQVK